MTLEFRTEKDVSDLVLDVVFDREGLQLLLRQLQWLHEQKTDHFHLFSESWGTGELTQGEEDRTAFNQVNIGLVADES